MDRGKEVTLWIDNVQVEAEEGTSVLNAALDAGDLCPPYLFPSRLEAPGGCKLCVVEIDGQEPVTSCTTTVAEGMHVKTKSDQLDRLRRASMNFIFAGHPGTAPAAAASATVSCRPCSST